MPNNRNPPKTLLDELPAPLKNRYIVSLIVFLIWMTFIDTHNFFVQWRLQQTVDKLQEDMESYRGKVKDAELSRYDMEINREKFAREKYYMKKSNEDVFIVIKDGEQDD